MSPGPEPLLWRPSASLEALRRRAQLLADIRRFFADRGVLEVETPVLSAATVTDLHLQSLSAVVDQPGGARRLFLQTSPEFAMKRLLAAGSGPIFQLARSFRDGEAGRWHNPEFTMLEWYRPGFDHHRLMDEMEALLQTVLGVGPAERRTYGELFESRCGLDPHTAGVEALRHSAENLGVAVVGLGEDSASEGTSGETSNDPGDRDTWLHLLWSHCVEPTLGREADGTRRPTLVFDFPASQAALAKIRPGSPPVAERFEVYVDGVELANGFHELLDADEQRRRFEHDLEERRTRGLDLPPIDEHLLAALAHGLEPCAGVALGVDRLFALQLGASSLAEVLAFPIDRA